MTSTSQAGPAGTSPPQPSGGGPGTGGQGTGRVSPFGAQGWLRWVWRQLTSMRTALILLFLLAVASVPGSLLPQQGIDPAAVQQYYTSHPALAPWLARLSLFNVFAAPWFAAIYLLLFLSLAGCVVPRTFRLARSARALPPPAPRHLARLPILGPAADRPRSGRRAGRGRGRAAAAQVPAAHRGRLAVRGKGLPPGTRQPALPPGAARAARLGRAGRAVRLQGQPAAGAGTSFANTVTALDTFHPGRLVSSGDLQPFSLTLNRFTACYVTSGAERGQPSAFNARCQLHGAARGASPPRRLRVNHPLIVDGAKVYLIGHGYAPVFKVTDGTGKVVFDQPVPFISVEQLGPHFRGRHQGPRRPARAARLRRACSCPPRWTSAGRSSPPSRPRCCPGSAWSPTRATWAWTAARRSRCTS